jgi:hypothetical protein
VEFGQLHSNHPEALIGCKNHVATATTQRVVTSNNGVTFPIRRAALFGAILSVNKHSNTYEND